MAPSKTDPFGARATLDLPGGPVTIYRLEALEKQVPGSLHRLPFSIKVLAEAVLRQVDGMRITAADVQKLLSWGRPQGETVEIPFKPARVLMQDFTGVPAVVDLAAMRSAMVEMGGDPERINPVIPVDLVIDHSVQVDRFGSPEAAAYNAEREFQRNRERYAFLRWGAESFDNFRVIPPDTGIVHQVNLEYLAPVVQVRGVNGDVCAFPDSLVGMDSHTTMINSLGVLGWGVGGIEAEAAMLGQPLFMAPPRVVGVRLEGELPAGATATDLVLAITQRLRQHGVVGKFVEFQGPGLETLSVADRATVANMAPEYGATMGFFPVDLETLRYLATTGREPSQVETVEIYCKEQGLFHTPSTPEPEYSERLTIDLSRVEPSVAGPRRPQDRVSLGQAKPAFQKALADLYGVSSGSSRPVPLEAVPGTMDHGSVVIAAITSCTNTSNPSVMLGAGLLAKKAVGRGLRVAPHVKTSLAPGSRVVTRYLEASGLAASLEALGFHLVGYGCTTCIGNSGPLPELVREAIEAHQLVAVSVLSGNRNFEGRINPLVKANYLASPPLVVAYALAGTMNIDLSREPLGQSESGEPVFLQDIWPTPQEVQDAVAGSLKPEFFREEYANVLEANESWNRIPVRGGALYDWPADSTYIREPPFFKKLTPGRPSVSPIRDARVLALLGDSVTTDHISPAGAIPANGPAGKYLEEQGVRPGDFNSFGSRRGNHQVMQRGAFGNIRIRNQLVPGREGGVTRHLPSGEIMSIYDAAVRYEEEGVPLLVIAGKEYGTGSSRDWAAKGTLLLGVRAVLARSYERIHRSNLIGMGILPLQFREGDTPSTLDLQGDELFSIAGVEGDLVPGQEMQVAVRGPRRTEWSFRALARLDTPMAIEYFRNGGILQTVLRELSRS